MKIEVSGGERKKETERNNEGTSMFTVVFIEALPLVFYSGVR